MNEPVALIEISRPALQGTSYLTMFRVVCSCAWVGPTTPRLTKAEESFVGHWERAHA